MIDNELKYAFKDIAKLEFLEGIERELLEAAKRTVKDIKDAAERAEAKKGLPSSEIFDKEWAKRYKDEKARGTPHAKVMLARLQKAHWRHEKALHTWQSVKDMADPENPAHDEHVKKAEEQIPHHKEQKKYLEKIEPSLKENKNAFRIDIGREEEQQKAEDAAAAAKEDEDKPSNESISFQSVVRGKIPIMEIVTQKELKKAGVKAKVPVVKKKSQTESLTDQLNTLNGHMGERNEVREKWFKSVKENGEGHSETRKHEKMFDMHDAKVKEVKNKIISLVSGQKNADMRQEVIDRLTNDSYGDKKDILKAIGESELTSIIHGFLGDQYMDLAEHFEQKGNSYDANYCYDKAIYFFENGGVSLKK